MMNPEMRRSAMFAPMSSRYPGAAETRVVFCASRLLLFYDSRNSRSRNTSRSLEPYKTPRLSSTDRSSLSLEPSLILKPYLLSFYVSGPTIHSTSTHHCLRDPLLRIRLDNPRKLGVLPTLTDTLSTLSYYY